MSEATEQSTERTENERFDTSTPKKGRKSKAKPIKPKHRRDPPTSIKELFTQEEELQGILKDHGRQVRQQNKRIEEIEREGAKILRRLERQAASLATSIHEYVEPNREALAQGKKKSIEHPAATLAWSELMQIVTNLSDKAIVQKLLSMNRQDLLRIEYAPSRTKIMEALLNERKKGKPFKLRGVKALREKYFTIKAGGIPENTRHNLRTGKIEIVVPRKSTPVQP